jgi:hypothetical protein
MIDNKDIFNAAKLFVGRYGDEAAAEALKRADQLALDSDTMGCAMFRQVATACSDLLSTSPGEQSLN